jgi:hypothetical protein
MLVWELRRIVGRLGSKLGHLKRIRGLPSTNSRVCASSAMDLAWERMKSADSAYWGLDWAVLIQRYCWNLDIIDNNDDDEFASTVVVVDDDERNNNSRGKCSRR